MVANVKIVVPEHENTLSIVDSVVEARLISY